MFGRTGLFHAVKRVNQEQTEELRESGFRRRGVFERLEQDCT
jgi:hypothetical protein